MIVTEAELRELWRDGRNALPAFPAGTRFSPAALDFLKDHALTPVLAAPGVAAGPALEAPPRSNPQSPLAFVARLDSLHALAGLVAAEARQARLPALAAHLDTLAAYCGELHAAASEGRPAPNLVWGGAPAARNPVRPSPPDHPIAHWLNVLRASVRAAEAGAPEGLRPALGRLGAAVEDMQRLFEAGVLAWQAGS